MSSWQMTAICQPLCHPGYWSSTDRSGHPASQSRQTPRANASPPSKNRNYRRKTTLYNSTPATPRRARTQLKSKRVAGVWPNKCSLPRRYICPIPLCLQGWYGRVDRVCARANVWKRMIINSHSRQSIVRTAAVASTWLEASMTKKLESYNLTQLMSTRKKQSFNLSQASIISRYASNAERKAVNQTDNSESEKRNMLAQIISWVWEHADLVLLSRIYEHVTFVQFVSTISFAHETEKKRKTEKH